MRADKYVEQLKDIDSEIEMKQDDERELWALATRITQNFSGMPFGSHDNDQMTGIVNKIIEARKRTNAKIDEYVDTRLDVIKHIEMLPTRQREVIHWLYVRKREKRSKGQGWYYTWSEVAENMGCTEQNVGKLRRKAIKNLQKILDSEEKVEKVD